MVFRTEIAMAVLMAATRAFLKAGKSVASMAVLKAVQLAVLRAVQLVGEKAASRVDWMAAPRVALSAVAMVVMMVSRPVAPTDVCWAVRMGDLMAP